ncbi:MAG: AraC family transcriptional regulator [Desulfovibrio sp.]|nr:AraC family transcriptional regulator [Desulfovibrio sp.]
MAMADRPAPPRPHAGSSEQARLIARPESPGVELLRAAYRTQRFDRHFHEEYALGVIEGGALRFRYLGQTMIAAAGQVNLVVPGEPHDGHAALPHGWAYRMFYLAPRVVDAASAELRPRRTAPHFAAGVLEDPILAARVRQTHLLWEASAASLLARQTALLEMLTLWISRHAEAPGAAPRLGHEGGAVARARALLQERFAEDLSLDDLAGHVGLSPWHLVRVFKARHGLAPHAYLVQVRLARARALLAGPDRLADIAAATGFADQSHLTRLFKARFGLTPGACRNFLQNCEGEAG